MNLTGNLKLILYFALYLFFFIGQAAAIDLLDDIPKDCNNNANMGGNNSPGHFYVGPLWVKKCDNVCSFDKNGKITQRAAVWFPGTTCGGNEKNTVTFLICKPDPRAKDCFKVEENENNPANYDCSRNGNENAKCINISRKVSCDTADTRYRKYITTAECG